mgnify:CR=1 FL=1
MARPNNFPTGQLNEVPAEFMKSTVVSLRQLYDKGKPETDKEVEERIDEYFQFCEDSSIRPGIESLSVALSVTRTTLWNWEQGIGCSTRRQELISKAKALSRPSSCWRLSSASRTRLEKPSCSCRTSAATAAARGFAAIREYPPFSGADRPQRRCRPWAFCLPAPHSAAGRPLTASHRERLCGQHGAGRFAVSFHGTALHSP